MSTNHNNSDGNGNAQVPWGTKAGYIGTGVLIGLVAYPFVRRVITQAQPKMDKIFDDLTGKAEGFAERASDLLARAREGFAEGEASADARSHEGHSHS